MSDQQATIIVAVDLDRTLFYTEKFNKVMASILADYNVVFEPKTEDYTFDQNGQSHFDLFHYLAVRRLDGDEIEAKMIEKIAPNSLLYDEVPAWLEQLVRRQVELGVGAEIVIITNGKQRFQSLKIQLSPLLADFETQPAIITLERKGVILAERFANQSGVLIDDKEQLLMPNNFTALRLQRSSEIDAGAFPSLATITFDKIVALCR